MRRRTLFMRLAHAPDWLGAFRERVAHGDTTGAMRLAGVLGLRKTDPQGLFEPDAEYVARLQRVHAPRRRRRDRVVPKKRETAAA
jgi:hypothetical protein